MVLCIQLPLNFAALRAPPSSAPPQSVRPQRHSGRTTGFPLVTAGRNEMEESPRGLRRFDLRDVVVRSTAGRTDQVNKSRALLHESF